MRKIAVYKRVSTDRQETHMQQAAIDKWLAEHAANSEVVYYEDKGVSGKTTKRPEFQRMLNDINAGRINCVLTYRLDRISRRTVDALRLLMDWIEQDVDIIFIDQPILNATSEDPFRMTKYAMFCDLAQVEAKTLSSRVKQGLQAAKLRGKKLGRPAFITDEMKERARELRAIGYSHKKIAIQLGVSRSAIQALWSA